jgi:hypothetical protein
VEDQTTQQAEGAAPPAAEPAPNGKGKKAKKAKV